MIFKELDLVALSHNPRASMASWERFRSTIIKAISSYPNRLVIEPTSLRAITYESRVRDAIRGAIAFGYPLDPYTTEDLIRWYESIVIRSTKTTVTLGPRLASGEKETEDGTTTFAKDHISVIETHTKVTDGERDAFVTLIGAGHIGSVTLDCVWPGWQPEHSNVVASIVDGKTILI